MTLPAFVLYKVTLGLEIAETKVHKQLTRMEVFLNGGVHKVSRALFASLPRSLGSDMQHGVKPLSDGTTVFLLQQDAHEKDRFVVHDAEGAIRYTIEISTPKSKFWNVYLSPQNTKVAVISLGLFRETVAILGTTTLQLKSNQGGLLNRLHRHFYDTEGNMYSWNRRSQYLERISNPNGKHEEHRKRVAYIHQLRNRKDDWELLIDTKAISEAEAITTAFATLKTQWRLKKKGVIPGVKASASLQSSTNARRSEVSGGIPLGDFTRNEPEDLRIYQKRDTLTRAREFFNPPSFLRQS